MSADAAATAEADDDGEDDVPLQLLIIDFSPSGSIFVTAWVDDDGNVVVVVVVVVVVAVVVATAATARIDCSLIDDDDDDDGATSFSFFGGFDPSSWADGGG